MKQTMMVFTVMMSVTHASNLQASSGESGGTLSGSLLGNQSMVTTAAGVRTPPPPQPLLTAVAAAAAARPTPPPAPTFACVNVGLEDLDERAPLLAHQDNRFSENDTMRVNLAAASGEDFHGNALRQRSTADNANRHYVILLPTDARGSRIRPTEGWFEKLMRGFETLSTCTRTAAGCIFLAYIIWPGKFSSN